jgi:hypothetical protein
MVKDIVEIEEISETHSDAKSPSPAVVVPPEILARREWIKHMRLKFCHRSDDPNVPSSINDDGTINQEYMPSSSAFTKKVTPHLFVAISDHQKT